VDGVMPENERDAQPALFDGDALQAIPDRGRLNQRRPAEKGGDFPAP